MPFSRDPIIDVRAFEDRYYESRPAVVLDDVIGQRDAGWNIVKDGDLAGGLRYIDGSLKAFGSLSLSDARLYRREFFASVSRRAQVLDIMGSFSLAVDAADEAADCRGELVYRTEGEHRFDQYRAIFDGSLALVLAGSSYAGHRKRARTIMHQARGSALVSEDPDWVMFANREMSEEERE